MAEKLAFHQVGGNAGAVDGHKRGVVAAALLMNGPRQQFLAGAAFTQNENGSVAFGQPRGIVEQRLHGRAFAHDAVEVAQLGIVGQ